jgi:hypothetical protein
MPIAIELIHNDIDSQIKKHNSAFLRPVDKDLAINKAQYDVLDLIITEYESNQRRSSADQDLLKLHTFTDVVEERTLPSDVYKLSTVFLGDAEGDLLDDKHFNDRLNSVILPPSASRPIATVYNDGAAKIRILPAANTHKIKYWKVPATAVFAYTQTDGVVTYNPTGSVNVGFPMSEYTKILNRTLFYLGIPSVNADVANLEKQA